VHPAYIARSAAASPVRLHLLPLAPSHATALMFYWSPNGCGPQHHPVAPSSLSAPPTHMHTFCPAAPSSPFDPCSCPPSAHTHYHPCLILGTYTFCTAAPSCPCLATSPSTLTGMRQGPSRWQSQWQGCRQYSTRGVSHWTTGNR
jgi:hypothetical protein